LLRLNDGARQPIGKNSEPSEDDTMRPIKTYFERDEQPRNIWRIKDNIMRKEDREKKRKRERRRP